MSGFLGQSGGANLVTLKVYSQGDATEKGASRMPSKYPIRIDSPL